MIAQVRPATVADAEAIAKVHIASWRWAYRGIVPDAFLATMDLDARIASWRRQLTDRIPTYAARATKQSKELAAAAIPFETFVAQSDSEIVGFVRCGTSRDDDHGEEVGEVYAIYLAQSAQGSGIGRNLFATATTHLRENGAQLMTVWVLTKNALGRRFYEAAGMVPDGMEQALQIAGHELPEIRYAKTL